MGVLRAGNLDQVVALQRRGEAIHDGRSRKPGAWVTVARRRASVQPVRGREESEADGRTALAVTSFWLRFDSVTALVTAEWSLVYRGQRFEIVAPPVEIGRREGVEIHAVASQISEAA